MLSNTASALATAAMVVGLAIHIQSQGRSLAQARSVADDPWSGEAVCVMSTRGKDYQEDQTHRWRLTGEPPPEGRTVARFWPAVWSVKGEGRRGEERWTIDVPETPAPIAIYETPGPGGNNGLRIESQHAQLVARRGIRVAPRPGITRTIADFPVWERGFPRIIAESAAKVTVLTDSLTRPGTRSYAWQPPSEVESTETCKWRFTRADSALSKTAPASPQNLLGSLSPRASSGGANVDSNATGTAAAGATAGIAPATATETLAAPVASNPTFARPVASVPAGFTARFAGAGGTGGAVSLSWQPVSGAVKYRLEGPGIASGGLMVAASTQGVTVNSVPPGAHSWRVAAVYANDYWDPNARATATLMLRFEPSHSPAWLTRNNGAGAAGAAIAHYISLCPTCLPGMTLWDFVRQLGFSPVEHFPQDWWATAEWTATWGRVSSDYYNTSREATYDNITDFGAKRTTRCLGPAAPVPYTLCYSLNGPNGQQGTSVIVRLLTTTWFLSFGPTPPGGHIFDQTLVDRTTFDSEGPKHLPHVCLSCHGGTYDTSTGRVNGAALLPLDPGILVAKVSPATSATPFLGVNAFIMNSLPPVAVERHLRGLYGADPRTLVVPPTYSSPTAPWGNLDYVPQAWADQSGLYRNIVRPYCIMCHLATPANQDFFSSSATFMAAKAQIHSAVCTTRSMPHSELPFKNFWTKDTGALFVPGMLAAALGYPSCP
jgi:hypothetical protein